MRVIETPVPIGVTQEVERFITDEHDEATKYASRKVLDTVGSAALHDLIAKMYALGYQEGQRAMQTRMNGARQRERDRAKPSNAGTSE
mgnify:CR=1 FL=1